MLSIHFERIRENYRKERRRERERQRQWKAFIQTEGPRYAVVNWITGGRGGIRLWVEVETDRLDTALAYRSLARAEHPPSERANAVILYDRVAGRALSIVGGVPVGGVG